MSTHFEYDNEPAWVGGTPGSILFVQDLRMFPRDPKQTPAWLTVRGQQAKEEYPREYAVLQTRFFRTLHFRPDGTKILMGLFRRERDDDVTSDASFRKDLKWRSTGKIVMWTDSYGDTTLREVTEEEAYQHLESVFGAGAELHTPMVESITSKKEQP